MLATEATPHEGCVADLSPLPYAAVALGQALVVVSVIWNWDGALVGILVSSVLVTALVVVRQFILARERTRLLEAAAARRDALLQLAHQFGARGIDPRLEQDAVQAARGLVGGEWVRFLRWEEQPTEQSAPPHGVGTSMAVVESELSAAGLEASRSGKAVARLRTPSLDSQGARDSILPLAVVAAPIGADGCTFGALTLARSGRDAAYTDADVQILSLLAGVIGGVLLGGSRARLEGALLAARTAEHELNNQLTGAAGFAELIVADDAASEQLREYARDILASSLEAARLVNEIRNLRRIALRGGAVPDATVIDVGNSAA